MPNQNKPLHNNTAPLDEITPHILRFWKARLTDKAIVQELRKVIDTDRYGIGITKLKEIRSDMGLKRARQQGHSVETIHDAMVDLQQIYPHAGSREMISLLFHEREMAVPRSVMKSYFATYEPDLVRQCKARRLCRKRFWAAGVNDLFAVDQHDKWLQFGLALHTGIEPFSGRIMWMRIWHSNKNPQLILFYYLDTLTELGHMPLVTQSDLGTENFGIANAHTLLRQWHDPALQGTLQHRWMRTKKNSQLRRRFTPGFENLLDTGVSEGWYDATNTLQIMVFRWVFIPWLQMELNAYKDRVNNTAKRRDRNKVLPHGIPDMIYNSPEDFGALDFKINIESDAIDHIRCVYINPSHAVFDLVPLTLGHHLTSCYAHLGCPVITRDSAWRVYLDLLNAIQLSDDLPAEIITATHDDELPLLNNHEDLPFQDDDNNSYYMGGVRGGRGLDVSHHTQLDALLADDEPDVQHTDAASDDDFNGLIVWEFTDDERDDSGDEW
ncbi:hypothetical protein EV702DRAFT_1186286 [Suillus placidus]|uniref:Integrase core domain-containing protein n=1 Tax=Suillus placidus TaxID=48579 RepID=A0A9P6ZZE9_9AGAM|nr:hypothetical protein EV702DRAFT_1186286 [Suillus placidus]